MAQFPAEDATKAKRIQKHSSLIIVSTALPPGDAGMVSSKRSVAEEDSVDVLIRIWVAL